MTVDELPYTTVDTSVRDRAVRRLKKRREFHAHILVYALVNTTLVMVWFLTGEHGFFWPIFPIAFWGIGVVMNGWDVYHGDDFSEEAIQREMHKIAGH